VIPPSIHFFSFSLSSPMRILSSPTTQGDNRRTTQRERRMTGNWVLNFGPLFHFLNVTYKYYITVWCDDLTFWSKTVFWGGLQPEGNQLKRAFKHF
jgi:hypothetical protein